MTRKGRAITLSINEQEKEKLEHLALLFGKTWGDKPNISKLIKAIANEELAIAPNHDWSKNQINAIETARRLLQDLGKEEEAIILAKLLIERSEANFPLKRELQKYLDSPSPQWRKSLDTHIKREHPFTLTYQDASGKLWSFTIRHASIVLHEDRQYLDCWSEETKGNQDISELNHNWSLRLDRIPEYASIEEIQCSWKSSLDYVDVTLNFMESLAFGYKTKKNQDLSNELDYANKSRQVVRRVSSSFWLMREIQRYGTQCEIIAPEKLRDRFRKHLKKTLKHYE